MLHVRCRTFISAPRLHSQRDSAPPGRSTPTSTTESWIKNRREIGSDRLLDSAPSQINDTSGQPSDSHAPNASYSAHAVQGSRGMCSAHDTRRQVLPVAMSPTTTHLMFRMPPAPYFGTCSCDHGKVLWWLCSRKKPQVSRASDEALVQGRIVGTSRVENFSCVKTRL